jgi:hypothetical protein
VYIVNLSKINPMTLYIQAKHAILWDKLYFIDALWTHEVDYPNVMEIIQDS